MSLWMQMYFCRIHQCFSRNCKMLMRENSKQHQAIANLRLVPMHHLLRRIFKFQVTPRQTKEILELCGSHQNLQKDVLFEAVNGVKKIEENFKDLLNQGGRGHSLDADRLRDFKRQIEENTRMLRAYDMVLDGQRSEEEFKQFMITVSLNERERLGADLEQKRNDKGSLLFLNANTAITGKGAEENGVETLKRREDGNQSGNEDLTKRVKDLEELCLLLQKENNILRGQYLSLIHI
eukprot:TRINITY_DN11890_c0_g1_i2.p1 TRINITY_DN11890_c0_g1~~TRINITY_DN11890_c0_g1_i2.p1  ORF type:complete len:236 (+),score=36.15 TRINITY_DN11890_c0_g1_i2:798-1505(+)